MSKIVGVNGEALATDAEMEQEAERMKSLMMNAKDYLDGVCVGPFDRLNIAMNLIGQWMIDTLPNDVPSVQKRGVQAMQILDAALGQALQMHQINIKVRENLANVRAQGTS